MPKHVFLQTYKASSASVRVPRDGTKPSTLHFCLSDDGFVTIELRRHVLKRLGTEIGEAIQHATPRRTGRSRTAPSANLRSK
jgi:hypothetical protein